MLVFGSQRVRLLDKVVDHGHRCLSDTFREDDGGISQTLMKMASFEHVS